MAQRTTTEDRISAALGSVYTNLGNRFRTLRGESAVNSEPIPAVTHAPAPAHSLASVANGGIATSTPRTTPEDRVSSAVKSGYSNLNNRFTVLRGEQPTVATLSQAENPAGSTSPPRQREVRGKLQPDGSRLVIDQRPVSMTPTVPVPNLAPATATPQRDGIQSANLTPEDQSSFVNATVDANQKLQQSRLSDVRPAAEMGPGSGWIRNEQTGEVVSIDGSGNVSMRDRDGNPIQRTTGRLGSVPPEQANPDGVQRVGNMDVTFAPETTAAQKQAFLTDPVKPEGQMIQYNNRALAEADRQEFNRNKEQNGMPELLTRENAPDMGWKSRQAINNQILETARAKEIAGITGQQGLALESARGENDMAVESARSRNSLENSRLLGEDKRNAAQAQSAMAETDLRQMEIGQAQAVMDLQKQLDNPKLSPEERKQVENKLYAIQGKPQQKYQITTRKTTDPVSGAVTETPYMIDAEGNAVEIGANGVGGNAEMLPQDAAQRQVGKVYPHTDGKYYQWDGKGLRQVSGR